jgi:hypothetical protein
MPTKEEATHIANEVYQKTGFPYVQGMIDGTHIEIAKPTSKVFCSSIIPNQRCSMLKMGGGGSSNYG